LPIRILDLKPSAMINIRKRFVVDENDNKIAVVLDMDTFGRIEEILKKHCLERELEDQKDDIEVDRSSGVFNKFG